jgi:glucose-6-phosphate dehydrogenase assembly protein OpcA
MIDRALAVLMAMSLGALASHWWWPVDAEPCECAERDALFERIEMDIVDESPTTEDSELVMYAATGEKIAERWRIGPAWKSEDDETWCYKVTGDSFVLCSPDIIPKPPGGR